ncbi:MAG: hypothetical protein ACUVTW_11155 [Thermogutta sp.]
MTRKTVVAMVTAAVLAAAIVLDFSGRRSPALGEASNQPFANAVEQRMEMIFQLRAIREAITEQNRLLAEQNKLMQEALQALKQPVPADRATSETSGGGDDKR